MRNISWANNAEFAHCFKPHGFALLSNVGPWATFFIGALDDLVVDIGDVGNETHRQTRPGEVPAKDVIDQSGTTMTQMGRAIDRGATQIDADRPRLAQCQRFHALRGGVVEVQHSDKPTI